MSRGLTKNCAQFVLLLTEPQSKFAAKAGVDPSSLRKFRSGEVVILRTTFNKIAAAFFKHYGVTIEPNLHFEDVPPAEKNKK